eukprot:SAG11_NODE_11031_length_788_cov_3.960813_1_plen_54_part_00
MEASTPLVTRTLGTHKLFNPGTQNLLLIRTICHKAYYYESNITPIYAYLHNTA